MTIGARVRIDGGEALQRALVEAIGRVDDLTPLMRTFAQAMAFASEEAFRLQRDPATGVAWRPLTARTAAALVTKGGARRGPRPILQVTGRLAGSITTSAGKSWARIGTNVVYAAIHQFGGRAGRQLAAQIPARPYIGLGPADLADMERSAAQFIEGVRGQ